MLVAPTGEGLESHRSAPGTLNYRSGFCGPLVRVPAWRKIGSMPQYMLQFSYSHESWVALVHRPEDRSTALEGIAKSLGGRMIALYYHSGEFDGTAIFEVPDDASANAAVMAVSATGALRATKTTRLFSSHEFEEALGKAGKVVYNPPSQT
jgi:uncharacterized protein with GYD domain